MENRNATNDRDLRYDELPEVLSDLATFQGLTPEPYFDALACSACDLMRRRLDVNDAKEKVRAAKTDRESAREVLRFSLDLREAAGLERIAGAELAQVLLAVAGSPECSDRERNQAAIDAASLFRRYRLSVAKS